MHLAGGTISNATDPNEVARNLLKEGADVTAVAEQTGLSPERVAELAASPEPDPRKLAKAVNARLRELGLSRLAASKLGYVSRSTLAGLGERVPSGVTLTNLDGLLSWEPGSARAVLYGRQPIAREEGSGPRRPLYDPDAPDDYPNLTRWIVDRLRELNMTRVRFAEISGVGRSTLATLGKRGYTPTPQTLERIDTHLMWEPGSAQAALKGGVPVRRGPVPTPHPALVPITSVKDRLRVLSARLLRQRDAVDQGLRDVEEMQKHVNLLYEDFKDPRRTLWAPPAETGGADQSETADSDDAEPGDDSAP